MLINGSPVPFSKSILTSPWILVYYSFIIRTLFSLFIDGSNHGDDECLNKQTKSSVSNTYHIL